MDLQRDWRHIRRVVARSRYCALASVDREGTPRSTPIGSVYLHREGGGFFLQRFTTGLPRNVDAGSPISLLAVDTRLSFWLRSLLAGRFPTPPAIRLQGRAGPRRPATAEERNYFLRRVGRLRHTRGGRILWSEFAWARDLEFDEAVPIRLGAMGDGLPRPSELA